jgi:hypothetical protein
MRSMTRQPSSTRSSQTLPRGLFDHSAARAAYVLAACGKDRMAAML